MYTSTHLHVFVQHETEGILFEKRRKQTVGEGKEDNRIDRSTQNVCVKIKAR